MKYNLEYTSVLRSRKGMGDDEGLINFLKKHPKAFDEVVIFAGTNFAPRSLTYHINRAKEISVLTQKLKALNIKYGINVHPTFGFFSGIDKDLKDNSKHVYRDGAINYNRLCPTAPENLLYVKNVYREYAKLCPDILYMDDDILGNCHCFCDNCIKKFSEFSGVFKETEPTRENLWKLFNSENVETRKKVREDYLKFYVKLTADILRAMEEGVTEVYPEAEIGIMQYSIGNDGLGYEEWINAMRGNTGRVVRMRPGGGNYTEFSMTELLDKVNKMGAQIRYVPTENTKIESEIENYPGHTLRKSANFTSFEALMYLAMGCTGTTYSSTCNDNDDLGECEPYLLLAEEIRAASKKIVKAFGREKTEGVSFWWDKNQVTEIKDKEWRLAHEVLDFPGEIQQIGIPLSYNTENAHVIFLNKNSASQMSDSEIKDVLSKAVFMDNEALDILNSRGFGEFTGFKTDEKYESLTCEWQVDHPFNREGKYKWWFGQGFLNNDAVYPLIKTDEKVEVLAEIRYEAEALFNQQSENPDYECLGIGTGIFENSLGGRICCNGAHAFDWYFGSYRNIRLKNILKWMSKDKLPYISSYHRAALWIRGNAAYVANIMMEEIENLEVSINTAYSKAKVTIFKGAKITEEFEILGKIEGNYKKFTIPNIPIVGSALIELI